jgi:hypothetical protein
MEEYEVAECTFRPFATDPAGKPLPKMDQQQCKDFVKRNVEDYQTFKQDRIKAKDTYFYRNMRAKPEINERSRKIVRSISEMDAVARFQLRPWTQRKQFSGTTSLSMTKEQLLKSIKVTEKKVKNEERPTSMGMSHD